MSKGNGHTHREKVVIPKAVTVLTANHDNKYEVIHEDVLSEKENAFQGHCVAVNSVKDARETTIEILCDPGIAKANYNVLSCKYVNGQEELKDSVDDYMEYGIARKILNVMHGKEV